MNLRGGLFTMLDHGAKIREHIHTHRPIHTTNSPMPPSNFGSTNESLTLWHAAAGSTTLQTPEARIYRESMNRREEEGVGRAAIPWWKVEGRGVDPLRAARPARQASVPAEALSSLLLQRATVGTAGFGERGGSLHFWGASLLRPGLRHGKGCALEMNG
jgi:hypothetical protein